MKRLKTTAKAAKGRRAKKRQALIGRILGFALSGLALFYILYQLFVTANIVRIFK